MTARAILRIGNGLFVGRGLDFQTLDCFRMNEFCIYTLGRNIRRLTVVGVALDKALDDTLAAVPDPVIVEASEKYRNVAGVDDVIVFYPPVIQMPRRTRSRRSITSSCGVAPESSTVQFSFTTW